MANTGKRGNMDIEHEERKAPGGERTGSGSQDVQSGRDSQTDTQRSNQQGRQPQNDRDQRDNDQSF